MKTKLLSRSELEIEKSCLEMGKDCPVCFPKGYDHDAPTAEAPTTQSDQSNEQTGLTLWRDLLPDERLQLGDRFYDPETRAWHCDELPPDHAKTASWPGWVTNTWQRRISVPLTSTGTTPCAESALSAEPWIVEYDEQSYQKITCNGEDVTDEIGHVSKTDLEPIVAAHNSACSLLQLENEELKNILQQLLRDWKKGERNFFSSYVKRIHVILREKRRSRNPAHEEANTRKAQAISHTPKLDWLRNEVTKLKTLLDDPHQGLCTWHEAVQHSLKSITDFFANYLFEK